MRLRGALIAIGLAAVAVGIGVAVAGPEVISGKLRDGGRTTCAVIGLFVWVGAFLRERRTGVKQTDLTAVLAGLALAAFTFEAGGNLVRALGARDEQGWNVFHYYMGAKYYPELGYGELYSAFLTADEEDGRRDYGFVRKSRSMATYEETPRRTLLARFDRRDFFSDERWEEFKRDVHALRPLLDRDKWKGALLDLGFHPSPAWNAIGTPLANLVSVRGRGWWWLVNSDLPLHLLSLLAMAWAFGARPTAAVVLWLASVPFNSANFAGGFLRHDFLHSVLLAAALWHGGRPATAGVALSWGAMARIFPGLLALPILASAVLAASRGGLGAVPSAHKRFLVGLTVACAVLFAASHTTGRGLATWPEWIDIIAKHGGLHPATSARRVGVARLVLHDPRPGRPFGSVVGPPAEQVQRRIWHRRAIQVAGFVLLLLALRRRRELDAMILMTFGVFLLAALSRYHGSIWALLFFLGHERAGPAPPEARDVRLIGDRPAVVAGAVLLAMVGWLEIPMSMGAQYYLVNYVMLALFTGLCVALWRGDRASRSAEGTQGLHE